MLIQECLYLSEQMLQLSRLMDFLLSEEDDQFNDSITMIHGNRYFLPSKYCNLIVL